MSVPKTSNLRIYCVLAGMAFGLAGWMYLTTPQGAAFLETATGKQIDVIPEAARNSVAATPSDETPLYETALIGVQGAYETVSESIGDALKSDGNSSFQSSSRGGDRSIGGAKFVSTR